MTTGVSGFSPVVKTASSKQILTIQYLRAFAALAVVVAHASGVIVGQAGVDVFFVISGFIMWTITDTEQSVFHFMKNRLVRIVPLYWVATLLMGLHQRASSIAIVKSMLFIPYVGESEQIWPVLVQGWTLNYEIFFYILVSVSLLFAKPHRIWLLLAAIVTLSSVGMAVKFGNPIFATYTNPLLLEFLFGIVLAELRFKLDLSSASLGSIFGVSALVLFWLSPTDHLPQVFRFASWGIPSALIVASALLFERSGWVPRITLLLVLGDASYAIYLFHTFLVKTVIGMFRNSFPAVDTIAVVIITSIMGIVIAYFVEKPFLRLVRGGIKLTPV